MTITTHISSYFSGKLVGEDQFGNRYFTEKKTPKDRKARRWVLYKSIKRPWYMLPLVPVVNQLANAEPSKVPPEWHGWLHGTFDVPPSQRNVQHYAWEKPHLPNLTGTKGAYLPPGHMAKGGIRAEATADYEAWKPE